MRRLTLALFVLLPLVAFARVGGAPTVTAGVPTDFTLSLDCDDVTAGVQSACTVPQGGSLDIELVLTNNTAGAIDLSSYEYELHNPSKPRLSPPPIFCTGTCLNSNPDFMLTGAGSANWTCGGPPVPDNDTGEDGAGTSVSAISCFNGTFSGPSLAPGSSTILGMVRYGVLNNGPAGAVALSLADAEILDNASAIIGSCNPTTGTAMTCNGTTVTVAPVSVLVDCNIVQPGIQSKCYVSNTLATRNIGVVARNNTNATFKLGTFNFLLLNPDKTRLIGVDNTGMMFGNPDFSADTTDVGDWSCGPPDPPVDTGADGDPNTQQSLLSCFNGSSTGPDLAPGGTVQLGLVRYNITAGADIGSITIVPTESGVYNDSFAERGSCLPVISIAMDCDSAEIVFYCQIDQADVVGTDGRVNSGDLGKVASVFGQLPAPVNEDQNFDGAINSGDLGLVASVFNQYVVNCP